MEVKDAAQIVGSFGGMADISAIAGADQAVPLSMLPYPPPIIEKAIETYMESLMKDGQYTEKVRAYLKTGYTMLSIFISDGEAAIVKNGQKAIANTMAAEEDSKKTSDREMDAAWDDYNQSIGILEKIQESMSERQEYIDGVELKLLLKAVGHTGK